MSKRIYTQSIRFDRLQDRPSLSTVTVMEILSCVVAMIDGTPYLKITYLNGKKVANCRTSFAILTNGDEIGDYKFLKTMTLNDRHIVYKQVIEHHDNTRNNSKSRRNKRTRTKRSRSSTK